MSDNVIDFPKEFVAAPEAFDLTPDDLARLTDIANRLAPLLGGSPKHAIGNLFGAVHAAQVNGITRGTFMAKAEELWEFLQEQR